MIALLSFLGTEPLLKSHMQKWLHSGLGRKRGVLSLSQAAQVSGTQSPADRAEPLMTDVNSARPQLHNHAAQIPVFSME